MIILGNSREVTNAGQQKSKTIIPTPFQVNFTLETIVIADPIGSDDEEHIRSQH